MPEPEEEDERAVEAAATSPGAARLIVQPVASIAETEEKPASLLPKLLDFIKLAGAAYAIGFAVIMVHTARLGGPVVEAFEFQNIVAGLPVWALLLIALSLWTPLMQPFRHKRNDQALANDRLLMRIIIGLVLYVPLTYLTTQKIIEMLGYPSISEKVILFCAVCFLGSLLTLWAWYKDQSNIPLLNVSFLLTIYSGLAFFVVLYAILLYPRVPQSVGGGHPVKVRLLLKDGQVNALLGGSEQAKMSNPIDLFYRTGSFLLVSKGMGQMLVQVPMSDVDAILYVDSTAK